MAYDNTNRGVLFRERDKKNEKGPDYTGTLDVDGKEYRVAGWLKEGSKGKFLSLSVEPKEKRTASTGKATVDDDDDSEIPF